MVERTNRWLEERLIMDRQCWPDRLPYWQFLFNQFANCATGVSPNELIFSFEPNLLFDNYFSVLKDDRPSLSSKFAIGDSVVIKNNNRLKQRSYFYQEAFKITDILGCAATLQSTDGRTLKRHFSQIKHCEDV